MALSKIQAESMNLADTYAFTGTVSGVAEDNLVKLASTTISSAVAGIDYNTVFSSTYNYYMITAYGITKLNSSSIRIRFIDTQSSPQEISTNNYDWGYGVGNRSRSAIAWSNRASDVSYMQIMEAVHGNSASFTVYVDTENSGSNHTGLHGTTCQWTSNGMVVTPTSGRYTLTTAIGGLKIYTDVGTFTSGQIVIYGMKK